MVFQTVEGRMKNHKRALKYIKPEINSLITPHLHVDAYKTEKH